MLFIVSTNTSDHLPPPPPPPSSRSSPSSSSHVLISCLSLFLFTHFLTLFYFNNIIFNPAVSASCSSSSSSPSTSSSSFSSYFSFCILHFKLVGSNARPSTSKDIQWHLLLVLLVVVVSVSESIMHSSKRFNSTYQSRTKDSGRRIAPVIRPSPTLLDLSLKINTQKKKGPNLQLRTSSRTEGQN